MFPPVHPAHLYSTPTYKSTPKIRSYKFSNLDNSFLFNNSFSSTNTANFDTMSISSISSIASNGSFMIPNLMNTNAVEIPPPPIIETINYKEVFKKISLKNLRYPDITKRLVIFDGQTTGDDPSKNNIIEIGCYEMFEGHCTGRQFHGFLHPRYDIDEFTEQKLANNVYIDFTKDGKESDCIVLENFLAFVGDSKIVAHNAELNMAFLNNEFAYHNKPKLPPDTFYCTLKMFQTLFPNIKPKATIEQLMIFYQQIIKNQKKKIRCSDNICSLLKCCEYLKIKVPRKTHFSAKFDSFLVSKLMARIFVIIAEVQKLHIKVREKKLLLLEKQNKLNNNNKDDPDNDKSNKPDKNNDTSNNINNIINTNANTNNNANTNKDSNTNTNNDANSNNGDKINTKNDVNTNTNNDVNTNINNVIKINTNNDANTNTNINNVININTNNDDNTNINIDANINIKNDADINNDINTNDINIQNEDDNDIFDDFIATNPNNDNLNDTIMDLSNMLEEKHDKMNSSFMSTNSNVSGNTTLHKHGNKKIIRSIYQDIYSDGNKEEEKKFDNIMELIEADYKNMDHSYYNQFKSKKVDNELINIIDNHKMELARIQRGQRINGVDLYTLRNRNRRNGFIIKNGKKYIYKHKNKGMQNQMPPRNNDLDAFLGKKKNADEEKKNNKD